MLQMLELGDEEVRTLLLHGMPNGALHVYAKSHLLPLCLNHICRVVLLKSRKPPVDVGDVGDNVVHPCKHQNQEFG